SAGGEVDRPHRYLRSQSQRIRHCRRRRRDCLAMLSSKRCNHFLRSWRTLPKTALNRKYVQATAHSDELPSPVKTGEGLINGCSSAKTEESFGGDGGSLRQLLYPAHDRVG